MRLYRAVTFVGYRRTGILLNGGRVVGRALHGISAKRAAKLKSKCMSGSMRTSAKRVAVHRKRHCKTPMDVVKVEGGGQHWQGRTTTVVVVVVLEQLAACARSSTLQLSLSKLSMQAHAHKCVCGSDSGSCAWCTRES